LVGIKGVAMTALAQMLIDAGKQVRGCDVAEEFVTQELLDKFKVQVDVGFDQPLPADTEAVIFTSAHQADDNHQVKAAIAQGIPTITQAEAIADLFNQQKGIAVAGVGGKSTTSAMITWILEKLGKNPSFFVGVGNIPGIERTGKWNPQAEYLVAEADEYVTNPRAKETGEEIIAKFSYLHPFITVSTNLKYDHPDVYRDFDHTKQIYGQFFAQTNPAGALIVSDKDESVIRSMPELASAAFAILSYGEAVGSTARMESFSAEMGKTVTKFSMNDSTYQLTLAVPGKYNALNALAAILACTQIGIDPQQAADTLSSFRSTKRRFEFIGEKNGVLYYDDYAHHPHEVESVIQALNEWFPNQRKVVAFQSHTFSRTKELFNEFVDSFANAQEVLMIDIFSSAREAFDPTVSSTSLCEAIHEKFGMPAQNVGTVEKLAEFCRENLKSGDVFLTIGAGNIYEVHDQI
jgi:UDP-N-acetylmuramate--alanine ligase